MALAIVDCMIKVCRIEEITPVNRRFICSLLYSHPIIRVLNLFISYIISTRHDYFVETMRHDYSSEPIHVLIVDDHEMVRLSLSILLQTYDDIVVDGEAATASEAVTLCAEKQPDIILIDYLMPEMNGVEATRLLREKYPELRVIMMSATLNSSLEQEAYDAGAACFLKKDINFDLYQKIHRVYETGHCF